MGHRYSLLFFVMVCLMAGGFGGLAVSPDVATAEGGAEWVQVGPEWATMFAISVDPNDPLRVYARSRAGIHRSTDGGATWELVEDAFDVVGRKPIVIDPTDSLHLMTINEETGDIHASEDGGEHWSELNDPFVVDGIVFDPVVNGRVWAFTKDEQGGVYRSVNHGETWEQVPFEGVGYPGSLLAHPTLANTLYAATNDGQVYISTNGGDDWEIGGVIGFRVLAAMTDSAMYAIYNETGSGGSDAVVRSTDNGATWEPFATGLPGAVTTLVIDPNDATQLYVGVRPTAVYRTATDDVTWELATDDLTNGGASEAPALAIAATQPATLYYAHEGVYQSRDQGSTWDRATTGLSAFPTAGVAVNPANSLHLLAAGPQNNLYTSTNGGTTWNTLVFSPTLFLEINSIAFAPSDSTVVYFGSYGDGVFRSADGGATWTPARQGLPMDGSRYYIIEDLKVDPTDANKVLAVVDGGAIYRTVNGGTEWTLAYDHGFEAIWQVAFAPTTPTIVWGATGNGLVKSTDGGATWSTPTTAGLPAEVDIRAVAVDPTTSNRLYVGVRAAAEVLFRSVDGGATWEPLTTGVQSFARVDTIWIDPAAPQTVLFSANRYDQSGFQVITAYGIRRSANGGDTWIADPNPPGYPAVVQLAGTAERLYAGMYAAGVWRLGDVPMVRTTYLPLIGRETE